MFWELLRNVFDSYLTNLKMQFSFLEAIADVPLNATFQNASSENIEKFPRGDSQ